MLLSATPHDGSARSFASLMSLLDPTAISDPDDYTPEDFRSKGLVIRRFSVFGVPLPLWLGPTTAAHEAVVDGCFRFDVEIGHPWTSLIVRYQGWLEPV